MLRTIQSIEVTARGNTVELEVTSILSNLTRDEAFRLGTALLEIAEGTSGLSQYRINLFPDDA